MYVSTMYTDNMSGNITHYFPILSDGSADPTRSSIFIGITNMQTNKGPMPINFGIAAQDLAQAISMFQKSLEKAVEEMQSEMVKASILNGGKEGRIIKAN